jgi:hypothetical protein
MQTIGRREYVKLPTLSTNLIEAKVDTGAFRSAIHCVSCQEVQVDGDMVLEAVFELNKDQISTHRFTEYHQRSVRSSFGESEVRYCVKLVIQIGRKKILSQVTLTNRSDMRYQILIGRKTLYKKYKVDVSNIHLKKRGR